MKIERRKKPYIERITAKKTVKKRLFNPDSMERKVKADVFKIMMESALELKE